MAASESAYFDITHFVVGLQFYGVDVVLFAALAIGGVRCTVDLVFLEVVVEIAHKFLDHQVATDLESLDPPPAIVECGSQTAEDESFVEQRRVLVELFGHELDGD